MNYDVFLRLNAELVALGSVRHELSAVNSVCIPKDFRAQSGIQV